MSKEMREQLLQEMHAWLKHQQHAIDELNSADIEVVVAAIKCFESPQRAGLFLISPAPGLAGRRPLEVVRTPEGKEQILNLIGSIEHGIFF